MAQFRIFTNDRGYKKGVALYSAFKTVDAADGDAAVNAREWPRNRGGAPAKAIEWPPVTEESKAWLSKHVGD